MTEPKLALLYSDACTADADAVIVGTVQGPQEVTLAPGAEQVDAAFDGNLAKLFRTLGASGKADEVIKMPTGGRLTAPVLVAVGLGKQTGRGISAEQVRRGSGAAARTLAGTIRAVTTLSAIDVVAATEGTLLGAYAFTGYKSDPGKDPVGRIDLMAPAEGNRTKHKAALRNATAIAMAVRTARDLVNTPPNDLYPASFAERAAELGKAAGIEVDVLDEEALRRDGYGGILGVGGGSARGPRLVRLTYQGSTGGTSHRGATKKVALVGKGVTFDTGGISIKPAAEMDQMTFDMAGAAAVVATVVLAAQLELPLEVIATVPMVENMPSGTAYRPGDVLTLYGGKTVEVLNTDAEGRLILSEAIVRASEDEPDYLVETSTLTGAQIIALGKRTAGIMGSEEFRDRVAALAQATGEGGWPMPLPEELRSYLDSQLADLANVTGLQWGGMLSAGLFLREFVPESLPWAHIDIAGPCFNPGSPWGYTSKGGTGVPVRTIAALLQDIAANG